MKNKFLSAMLSGLLLASMPIQMYANAVEENTANTLSAENTASVYAAGLIATYTLSCTSGSKTVYIDASVYGTATMSKIGFKNIKVQKLVDNKWVTEKPVDDKISENAAHKFLTDYAVSVEGGHYYRVVLDHYAKENTWWFPATQTVGDDSDPIWVPL